jgi:pilus assembly protein Flp/PilA
MRQIKLIAKLISDESGATAIEYGVIVALIAVVCIASIQSIGTALQENFQATANAFPQ